MHHPSIITHQGMGSCILQIESNTCSGHQQVRGWYEYGYEYSYCHDKRYVDSI